MSNPTERVVKLREHARSKKLNSLRSPEGELLWNRGWLANHDASSRIVRKARTKAYMLCYSTVVIDDGELIVGKPCFRELNSQEQEELKTYKNLTEKAAIRLEGQDSHMAIDYEKLLKLGISGIQQQICGYRQLLNLEVPQDMEKDEFYKACLEALDGVIQYSERYARHSEELALQCSDAKRKGELLEIAQVCRKVPRFPAATFREALQSIHFVTICLEGLYQLGRPDRFLLDYYTNDLKEGILNSDSAQELIDCLCILFNEYILRGAAVGFMVGGRDAGGKDVCNALTYLFIESIGHTRMIYPGIGLCYTKDTPNDLLIRSCELLAEGLTHPALFNDEVISCGLREYGLPADEACEYIHSACVEITPVASSGVWVASPYINLLQPLLDLIGIKAIENYDESNKNSFGPGSFDELKAAYKKRLADKIRQEAIDQNRIQMERHCYGGNPLVSCFVNDCLARGRDIDQGGARYNWIMPSFVGLANLVDSFMAIKRLVYDEQKLNMNELAKILKNDYKGYEEIRQAIMNRVPKYGNDEDEVDSIALEATRWITEEIEKYRTYRGDKFIPGLFCWVMHQEFGKVTGATPDGRSSGFPLGDGSGPAQGSEKKGPTASILSSTKWEHSPFIGGIAVNLKFSRSLFKVEHLGVMTDLIKTFMARGGFELQINVVDRRYLLEAKKNPEAYRDLVVRIGGYSDYFASLTAEMQEEVILRTEHEI